MLSARTLYGGDGVEIADVACTHGRGRGHDGERAGAYALVFVRRGCFVRSADGIVTLLDPTLAYCMTPEQEQRYDHPYDHGDDCTSLLLDRDLFASMWGGEATLPAGALAVSPAIDLQHRLLLSAVRAGADRHEVLERTIALTALALEQSDPRRVGAGRPATASARRAVADGARELLAERPELSLSQLARELAVSPHHLSRVFAAATGHTISRHRMRLRARGAMEAIAGGERNLGRLAADLGFADQSHLSRVVRSETGHAPSELMRRL
jgi:AraC-like DNA-binding protein